MENSLLLICHSYWENVQIFLCITRKTTVMRTMVHKSVLNPCLSQVRAYGIHLSPPFINWKAKQAIHCSLLLRAKHVAAFGKNMLLLWVLNDTCYLVASQFG